MTASFFARIDSWWKAAAIIAAAVAVGFTFALSVVSFVGMPARVEANALAHEANAIRIVALEAQLKADGQTAQRNQLTLETRLDRVECLVIAGRRSTPIEDCL